MAVHGSVLLTGEFTNTYARGWHAFGKSLSAQATPVLRYLSQEGTQLIGS
jgi:hypothetical protein